MMTRDEFKGAIADLSIRAYQSSYPPGISEFVKDSENRLLAAYTEVLGEVYEWRDGKRTYSDQGARNDG